MNVDLEGLREGITIWAKLMIPPDQVWNSVLTKTVLALLLPQKLNMASSFLLIIFYTTRQQFSACDICAFLVNSIMYKQCNKQFLNWHLPSTVVLTQPWVPATFYKSMYSSFPRTYSSHQVPEDASWTYLIGIGFKGNI